MFKIGESGNRLCLICAIGPPEKRAFVLPFRIRLRNGDAGQTDRTELMLVRDRKPLVVRLASPRGFCAGVERAVRTVETALSQFGAPVYVRHEIVHNTHVVTRLAAMGAVFIESLSDAPPGFPLIVSAHGAPQSVVAEARTRQLHVIDATCPLVHKVHSETRRHVSLGRHVILIGHGRHPEVEGTMGQAPSGAVSLIQNADAARSFEPPANHGLAGPLAYVTQTTLSVDETAEIVAILRARFPSIVGPASSDICYATTNRQTAAKRVAKGADLVVVIGSATSSNSCRLVDAALAAGAKRALLIDNPEDCDLDLFNGVATLGLTAGASAPEDLVETLLLRLAQSFSLAIETVETAAEDVVFKAPIVARA